MQDSVKRLSPGAISTSFVRKWSLIASESLIPVCHGIEDVLSGSATARDGHGMSPFCDVYFALPSTYEPSF